MANTVIFPEQSVSLTWNSTFGAFCNIVSPPTFYLGLGEGNVYDVAWGADTFTNCAVQDARAAFAALVQLPIEYIQSANAIGNLADFGGTGNGEPFIIAYVKLSDNPELGSLEINYFISLTAQSATEINVRIDAVYEPEEPELEPSIVLKDLNGDDNTYADVEKVELNNTDGETVMFSKGEVIDEPLQINLDFTNGNQMVEAPEGYLVKSAVIAKPTDLLPENILKDKDIGGVIGTAELGGTTDIPQLYPISSIPTVLTSSSSGLQYLNVVKPSSNGDFAPAVEVSEQETKAILAIKDVGSTFYGYNFTDRPITQPFRASARLVRSGFRPSEYINGTTELWLTKMFYSLKNCELDTDYQMLFAGDTPTFVVQPDEGFYLPKKVNLLSNGEDVPFEYDSFNGTISLTVPQVDDVTIVADAQDAPWLHNPVIDFDSNAGTVEVLYLDENAESTDVMYNDEVVFQLEDLREGMADYAVTTKAAGATYGFSLTGDGYYQSDSSVAYGAAVCRVEFDMATEGTVQIQYVHYGSSSTTYGIVGKVDNALSPSFSTDIDTTSTKVYTNFKNSNSTSLKTLSLTIPAGRHFVDFKFRRYASASTSYYFKFKVATTPAEYTVYNLADYWSDYGIYPLQIQSVSNGYTPSDVIDITYTVGATISIDNYSVLTILDITTGVQSIGLYVDDILIDTVPYDGSKDWSLNLTEYADDDDLHYVAISAIGEGIPDNRSNRIYTALNAGDKL